MKLEDINKATQFIGTYKSLVDTKILFLAQEEYGLLNGNIVITKSNETHFIAIREAVLAFINDQINDLKKEIEAL